jgi:membrane protein YdbS with pleckstrin-like domain
MCLFKNLKNIDFSQNIQNFLQQNLSHIILSFIFRMFSCHFLLTNWFIAAVLILILTGIIIWKRKAIKKKIWLTEINKAHSQILYGIIFCEYG